MSLISRKLLQKKMIMESLMDNPGYSPHLKKVLKSYQSAAMNSLSGPSNFMATWSSNSSKLAPLDLDFKKGTTGAVIVAATAKSNTTTAATVTPISSTATTTAKKECLTSNCDRTVVKLVEYEEDPLLAPPPFPIQQVPILTAPDQSRSERSETVLEGETISCFLVGGEKRLCLPQILNSVLRDFSLQQINTVCDELQIFCSRCTHEQLEVLKVTGILPFSAPSCGLITKTDAERLCNALLHSHPPRAVLSKSGDKGSAFHFKIYHECFGKCKGIYTPDHYASPHARCIECAECRGLFSPQKFVGHAHKALQNRTCHWGFDSVKWRAYILLAMDQEGTDQLQKHLDEMKSRYDCSSKVSSSSSLSAVKRKQLLLSSSSGNNNSSAHEELKIEVDDKQAVKKLKSEDQPYYQYVYDPMIPYLCGGASSPWSRMSAFRPWSPVLTKDGKLNLPISQAASFVREGVPHPMPPYLSHGPPVLLNPERVVPLSETERFERHYQPNVALAPPAAQISALQKANTTASGRLTASSRRPQAPPPPACNPEIEISTDTDETSDSATCSSVEMPLFGNGKVMINETAKKVEIEDEQHVTAADEKETEADVAIELKGLKDLLEAEGLVLDTQERVMNHVSNMFRRLENLLDTTESRKKALEQDLKYVRANRKEKLREASETKRRLRKEMEQMYEDHLRREREFEDLKGEMEAMHHVKTEQAHEACQVNVANEHLRYKIDAMGDELSKLQQELVLLRRNRGGSLHLMSKKAATSVDGAYDYSGIGAGIVKQELMEEDEVGPCVSPVAN